MLKPEDQVKFAETHAMALMAIVVDVLGRDAADRIAAEWLAIRKGEKRQEPVRWPRF